MGQILMDVTYEAKLAVHRLHFEKDNEGIPSNGIQYCGWRTSVWSQKHVAQNNRRGVQAPREDLYGPEANFGEPTTLTHKRGSHSINHLEDNDDHNQSVNIPTRIHQDVAIRKQVCTKKGG